LDTPADRFTSAYGLIRELRRSPRTDSDLSHGSQYCSQRLFQFNLVLDGISKESVSVWIRTINGKVISRFSHRWPSGEVARLEGFAQPDDFSAQWQTYLSEVAERRQTLRIKETNSLSRALFCRRPGATNRDGDRGCRMPDRADDRASRWCRHWLRET